MEAHFHVLRTTKVVETNTSDAPVDRSALGVVRGGFCSCSDGRRGGRNVDHNGGRGNGGRDGEQPYTCFNCGQ